MKTHWIKENRIILTMLQFLNFSAPVMCACQAWCNKVRLVVIHSFIRAGFWFFKIGQQISINMRVHSLNGVLYFVVTSKPNLHLCINMKKQCIKNVARGKWWKKICGSMEKQWKYQSRWCMQKIKSLGRNHFEVTTILNNWLLSSHNHLHKSFPR